MAYKLMKIAGLEGGASTSLAGPIDQFSLKYGGTDVPTIADSKGYIDIAVGLDGSLYVCLEARHAVIKIDPRARVGTLVAGALNTIGSGGDGGLATSSTLNYPSGIAVHPTNGNLYIADRRNHKVRMVDYGTGIITTVAGTGAGSSGADGSAATATAMNKPCSVAVNADGSFWVICNDVLDGNDPFPRYVNTSGIVSTPKSIASIITETGMDAPDGDHIGRICLRSDGVLLFNVRGLTKIWALTTGGTLTELCDFTVAPLMGMGLDNVRNHVYMAGNGQSGVGGSVISKLDSLTGGFVAGGSVAGDLSSPGTYSSFTFPADGTDGFTQIPIGKVASKAEGFQKLVVDRYGTIYVAQSQTVYKLVETGLLTVFEAFEAQSSLTVVKTNTVGFDDSNSVALIQAAIPAVTVENQAGAGVRDMTSLSTFTGTTAPRLFLGSSYSLADVNDLEVSSAAMKALCRGLLGAYKVDFQNRGGGDGTGYGSTAPRVRLENKNGVYLVERWLNGLNVNDYAVVVFWRDYTGASAGKMHCLAAGIRDISTKGAAFVAANATASYSSAFAATNAVLVRVVYAPSINDPADFTPTTSNCVAVSMHSVNSIHP